MVSNRQGLSTISEPVVRELIQASSLLKARVIGQARGFAVVFKIGTGTEKILARQRGGARMFASLDTAGAFIRDLGLPGFEVDMTGHEPGRLRKPRPDRAEALRGTRTKMSQQDLEF